ncbi:IS3 family transposase [Dactylosporangium sp. NPDC005572]|uniref:IS3 family transposase n=1 Tax=Dactylosporangium sp. NPDC005572 TaxID=3156889 RepID=UPI00339DDC48
MTEIATGEGKLYLATVIDLYSRRILGYAMGDRHDADLVVAALNNMAAVTRGGNVAGVIFNSDRGTEYCSSDFARACARWKVHQSMGRVGSCFDAVAEATFSTLKVEYVHRRQFRTRAEARIKIATWITDFYNHRRRHSVCDGRSPIDYERSRAWPLEAQAV